MKRKRFCSDKRNDKWCVGIISSDLKGKSAAQTDPDLIAHAKRHGINPEATRYFPQLARYPGDPEAFVATKDDIRRTLEKRGWGGEGVVNVKPRNNQDPAYKKPDRKKMTINDVIRWE